MLVLLGLGSALAQERAAGEPSTGDIQILRNPRETVIVFPRVGPVDKKGELVGPGDLDAQLNQVVANIRRLAAGVGVSTVHIVTVTVYTISKKAAGGLEKLAREAFLDGNPGIALVEVKELRPSGALVEVEAVAVVRPLNPRR
jgi:enamine deaminase RidA (YjgF/YER057c/UK114 family)